MRPIFKILKFTSKYWKWYAFMSFFIILISIMSLIVPFLSKLIVDIIVGKMQNQQVDFNYFILVISAIIITDLISSFLTAYSQWIGDLLTVKLQSFLSFNFYKHILNLHIGFYDNEITGRIVNKMYRGISSITEFIQSMLNNFLPFFLTAFVTIILLSLYSPLIGILLTILFPIYILISHKSSLEWQTKEQEKNIINDSLQGRVFERISGIRVVKSFSSEILELTHYLTNRKKLEEIGSDQTKKWHIYDLYRRLSLNIILFGIYTYVVYYTFLQKFTIGEMTFLLQLVNQARFPLFAMSFILGQIQQASSGSADFFSVLSTKSEIYDEPDAKNLKLSELKSPLIKFENVSFEYDSKKTVLKDINFEIQKGDKLALVGESGEGKSTIINLLLRYYLPQKGNVFLGGSNINNISKSSLYEKIAVVFQESLLFSGSILENIMYGNPKATFSDVKAAAKAANADNFINSLPQKYDSLIGERGVKLSGGQKQRIAIARAMIKNAPIIILDEATSSLDSKSELEVQKGLDNLLSNRTSIIIAHRLSTISNADNILVLSKGQIAQYGKPDNLLKDKKGIYYELVSLQKRLLTKPTEKEKSKLGQFELIG